MPTGLSARGGGPYLARAADSGWIGEKGTRAAEYFASLGGSAGVITGGGLLALPRRVRPWTGASGWEGIRVRVGDGGGCGLVARLRAGEGEGDLFLGEAGERERGLA